MKRLGGSIQLDFGVTVDAANVIAELAALPISYSNRDGLVGAASLRLNNVSNIELCARNVKDISAEAAAILLAVDAWTRANTTTASFTSDVHDALNRLRNDSATRRLPFFYSKVLKIPRVKTLGKESEPIVREVERSAQLEANHVVKSIPVKLSDAERGWIFEFILETMLNVAEHSGEDEKSDAIQTAFLAVKLRSQPDLTVATQTRHTRQTKSEQGWESANTALGKDILELSVCDLGQGIPQSLAKPYIAAQRERGVAVNTGRAQLHNEVLAWAMTPFGTRKNTEDFLSNEHGSSWRGLYRIAFRTQRLGGMVGISSGSGRITITTAVDRWTALSATAALRGLPWTSICAKIPLGTVPIPLAASPQEDAKPINFKAADVAQVQAGQKLDVLDSHSINLYCEAILRALEKKLHLDIHQSETSALKYVPVLHPSIQFSTPRAFEPAHLLGVDGAETPVPQLLWQMFRRLMMPGIAFVHFFLDESVPIETFDETQEYIYTQVESMVRSEQYSSFGVHGIYRAKENRIIWLLPARPDTERTTAVALTPSALQNRNTRVWSRFVTATGLQRGRDDLPRRVHPESLRRLLDLLLPMLTARFHSPNADSPRRWHWRAEMDVAGQPREGVQVSGNRLAFEYLNSCSLCESIPAVFYALRNDFLQYLDSFLGQGIKALLIIPDSEILSRFLLSRLEQEWREIGSRRSAANSSPMAVTFCNVDDVALRFSPGDRIVVFADFALSGESIARRINLIEKIQNLKRSADVDVYIFISGGALTKSLGDIRGPRILARYPVRYIPVSGAKGIPRLSIDPISNDLIPSRQTKALAQYTKLRWGDNAEDAPVDLVADHRFEYGIRFVSGRYFVCRWPVQHNLLSEQVLALLVGRLTASVRDLAESRPDVIVILVREDSTLRDRLSAIAASLGAALSEPKELAHLDVAGVSVGVIEDRRYVPRRLSAHNILNAINDSTPLTGTGQLFDLLPFSFRRSQLPLEGFERSLVESRAPVPRKIGMIFLDNAAVSGKTIHELIHSISQLQHDRALEASGVHVHCAVTRLSPTEESVMRQLTLNFSREKYSLKTLVPFRFEALVQLRIRSYRNFSSLRAVKKIEHAINESRFDSDTDINNIRVRLAQTLSDLSQGRTSQPLTSFFGNLERPRAREQSCPQSIVELRQLLALMQQGIPCTQEILDCFRALAREDAPGIVMMFGLEPDLLEEDILRSRLAFELEHLCLQQIDPLKQESLIVTALWVLANLRQAVDCGLEGILSSELLIERILPHYVFLVLYVVEEPRRALLLQEGIRQLALRDPAPTSVLEVALINLRGALILHTSMSGGEGTNAARYRLEDYLAQSRSRHGTRGHAAWMRIRDWHRATKRALTGNQVSKLPPIPPSPPIVEEAERWLKDGVIPAMRACWQLGERVEKLAQRVDQLRGNALQLSRLFSLFHLEMQKLQAGEAVESESVHLWGQIEERTTGFASDVLYGNPGNFRYLYHEGRRRAELGGFTNFEFLLAAFVAEPVFILLGKVACTLHENCAISYSHIDSKGAEWKGPFTLVTDLVAENLLSHRWFLRRSIGLLWFEEIALVEEAIDILLGNFKDYGLASLGINISTRDIAEGERHFLEISISNSVAPSRAKGAGHGINNVEQCMRSLGGSCTVSPRNQDPFAITLRVPVHQIPLQEAEA